MWCGVWTGFLSALLVLQQPLSMEQRQFGGGAGNWVTGMLIEGAVDSVLRADCLLLRSPRGNWEKFFQGEVYDNRY